MKYSFLFICLLFAAHSLFSQSNIQQPTSINSDGAAPAASAMLDVQATDKGMLVPRMTTAQRTAIASPAAGLLVFDTTTGSYWFYRSGLWNEIATTSNNGTTSIGYYVGLPIPDNNPAGVVSTIPYSLPGTIEASTNIRVCVNITHTWDADLDITLIAPDGTTVDLSSDNGGGGDNYTNTCFTNSASINITEGTAPFTGDYLPEQSFSSLISKTISGNWSLQVVDDESPDEGFFDSWSIQFRQNSSVPDMISSEDGLSQVLTVGNGVYLRTGDHSMSFNRVAFGVGRLEMGLNTLIGSYAGDYLNNSQYYNTYIGSFASQYAPTNQYCTSIGANSDIGDFSNGYNNASTLGYDASANADNYIRIGNTSVSSIGGQVGWSNYSDGRFKRNIQENVAGLDFITRLRPVTYQWDIHALNKFLPSTNDSIDWASKYDIENLRFSGFVAQEVEEAANDTGYDFSGVDKPKNEFTPYALRYAEFVVPLVKGMQEQQIQIEQLQSENASLKAQLHSQSVLLEKIGAALQGAGIAVEK
jgi:subtilisin-like proprotein convertase family protein